MSGLRFTATLERQGPGTFIAVPLDLREKFGRARPPVRVTINGHTYRSTPGIYDGIAYLPVNKANRAAAGVEAGDIVEVALALDTEPRAIDVPADVRAAPDVDAAVAVRFAAMSFSHRREYVEWIEEAKRPETRERRIARAVERVRAGLPQRS